MIEFLEARAFTFQNICNVYAEKYFGSFRL